MCSSSGTSHLAAQMILLGGSRSGSLLLGIFHIPCPLPQPFENDSFPPGREPCIPWRCPWEWGGQSLSQQHLERSAEALPAQSACHHRSLQVSHEVCVSWQGSTRLASCDQDEEWVLNDPTCCGRGGACKAQGMCRFALCLPWGLFLEHPLNRARLMPQRRAEHPPP